MRENVSEDMLYFCLCCILQYTDDEAFDIRELAILAMRKRKSVSEVYDVIYVYMRHMYIYICIYM
jgi:hypothetical protein